MGEIWVQFPVWPISLFYLFFLIIIVVFLEDSILLFSLFVCFSFWGGCGGLHSLPKRAVNRGEGEFGMAALVGRLSG
jgi:hypothetical protein